MLVTVFVEGVAVDGDDGLSLRAVELLDVDPDLGRHVIPEKLERLRRALTVPAVEVRGEGFDPAAVLASGENAFMAVVVSGLLAREVGVGTQPMLQLLGPGDAFNGSDVQSDVIDVEQSWSVVAPAQIALLDDRFLHAVRHCPRLMTGVVERLLDRHDLTLLQLAIAQHPRVEERLLLLLRILAERWGRVTPQGVHLDIGLTHEALGRLVGARRPTVTLALRGLVGDGLVTRGRDRSWIVSLDEPAGPRLALASG